MTTQTAFQPNAFQNNAFQIGDQTVVVALICRILVDLAAFTGLPVLSVSPAAFKLAGYRGSSVVTDDPGEALLTDNDGSSEIGCH